MERYFFQATLIVIAVTLAWWRGSKEHRWVATTIAAMFLATTIVALIAGHASDFSGIPLHRVAFDFVAFAVFLRLWLVSNSWWVLWVSSAQLLSVLAHLARMLDLPLPPIGYAVMEMWPVWFIVAITLFSVVRHILVERDNQTTS